MMLRRHRYSIAMLFLLCDLFVTSGVWFASYFVRFAVWDAPQGVPRLWLVVQGLPIVLALAAVAYRLCGMYEVHRLRRWASESEVVSIASGLLFLLTTTVTFYRRDLYESRLALGLFLVLNAGALIAARRAMWRILQSPRRRRLAAGRAIIIGAGRAGRRVADTLESNTWAGLRLIGFVDKPGKLPPGKAPLLGDIDQLARVVANNRVDHVFIALPLHRYCELPAVYKTLSDVLVEVQLVPDVPNLSGMRVRTLDIDDVPFLSLRENPHFGWRRLAKRSMDLALGSLALLGLAPLMALLAVLVKLTSQGPVFFRQPRRARRTRFPNAQVSQHARRRRARNGPRLGQQG